MYNIVIREYAIIGRDSHLNSLNYDVFDPFLRFYRTFEVLMPRPSVQVIEMIELSSFYLVDVACVGSLCCTP